MPKHYIILYDFLAYKNLKNLKKKVSVSEKNFWLQNWFQNWTLILVPDTETKFWSLTAQECPRFSKWYIMMFCWLNPDFNDTIFWRACLEKNHAGIPECSLWNPSLIKDDWFSKPKNERGFKLPKLQTVQTKTLTCLPAGHSTVKIRRSPFAC